MRLARIGLSGSRAEAALDAFFGSILGALRDGRKVSIVGLGTWEWRTRGPRLARNPKTGRAVALGSRKVLFFRPSPRFKQYLRKRT